MDPRPRLATLLTTAFAISLLASACSPAPSPSPTATPTPTPVASPEDPAAVYRAIQDAMVGIRDLQPVQALEPVVLDEAALKANLLEQVDRDNTPEEFAADGRLLTALGLLPEGADLRAIYLELLGDQVAGYYSPDDKALFVVSRSGGLGPTEKATYAHEFVHELQDQHFDLGALGMDDRSAGDRALARTALVEGDASFAQTAWMLGTLSQDELARLAVESSDPALLESLMRAPAILRETLLFPYVSGQTFVTVLQGSGGNAAVDAAFADPPDSTEQILHPEKYLAREVPILPFDDAPGAWSDALGRSWTVGRTDTLGEFQMRVWLRELGVLPAQAEAATIGWGGDRVVLWDGPAGGWTVELATHWDSATDGVEFETAAQTAVSGLPNAIVIRGGPTEVHVLFGTDRAAVGRLAAQVRSGG